MQKTIVIGEREYPVYAFLVVREGTNPGREYPLYQERVVIGRDGTACQIAVDDKAAGRQHCAVVFRDGNFFLSDLASTNGTYVNPTGTNDRPIDGHHMLDDGDVVGIGKTRFVFKRVW
jgi:pSer/pThr/pTyr-binding forkhead associated (FHA) protein